MVKTILTGKVVYLKTLTDTRKDKLKGIQKKLKLEERLAAQLRKAK